jgi:hypothetical protein
MHVVLVADGLAPLVMHSDRLADPLDSHSQALHALSATRKKTRETHAAMADVEWHGGLYTDPPLEHEEDCGDAVVGLPSWNVLRCLQDGARRHKRGVDVLRGCTPLMPFAPLQYDGPQNVEELWLDGGFFLRKPVGVSRSRVIRTRPMFTEWRLELPVEVDSLVWNEHDLKQCWESAGAYSGLCEMRPVYGRFAATVQAPVMA